MNHAKLILAAALLGVSATAMAVDTDAAREQRINESLENYRSSSAAAQNPSPGRFARAEESTKRGVKKAAASVKHGAQKAGNAVKTGAEKTGAAIRRGGEKMKEKVTPAQ